MRPPIPLPAAAMLFANDRLVVNPLWDESDTGYEEETHSEAKTTTCACQHHVPRGEFTRSLPCERNKCQILVDQEAPRSPASSRTMPMASVTLVPNLPTQTVATGAVSSASEMDRPPMNAYSKALAPGKVSYWR